MGRAGATAVRCYRGYVVDQAFPPSEPRIAEVDPADSRSRDELYALLGQLRPDLTRAAFARLLAEGTPQGLRYLLAYGPDGAPVGAAGWRVLTTSRGRVLLLEDLVTDEVARSRGIGTALLDAVCAAGRRADCTALELDSGVANAAAHRFYFQHRMSVLAFHFALPFTAR